MRGAYAAITLCVLAGCAWDAGQPFGVLSARIEASVGVPDGRDAGQGWQKMASSYELRFDSLIIEAENLSLLAPAERAGGFDPANPPPGYSSCHNGHCHDADGNLVDYEDIAAEQALSTSAGAVVALDLGTLDLVAGTSRALTCLPSCDLPRGTVTAGQIPIAGIRATGMVRDSRAVPRIDGEARWQLSLTSTADSPLLLSIPLDIPIDRGHAPEIGMLVRVELSSALFDDVYWDGITPGPLDDGSTGISLASSAEALASVQAAVGETELAVTVTR